MLAPHALPHDTLLRIVEHTWTTLWTTRVGSIPLRSLHVDSQVIGKFFQELMIRELHAHDAAWRHPDAPRARTDPDFVHTLDPYHNFELKMSGQPGTRVYGNRCSSNGIASPTGKCRDGWLLTINYTGTTINLVRFGAVNAYDWIGQTSVTGNASRLHPEAYVSKLQVVRGSYQSGADVRVLRGISRERPGTTVGDLAAAGHAEALAFLNVDYYY
jgi:hypothetical protein